MHNENIVAPSRRSSRVPTAVPILVTSLDDSRLSEFCETLVVNAHGCAMLSRVKFATGIPLHFHTKDGRETMAHVVSCQPLGSRTWRVGARLDLPQNFWGLRDCPKDWTFTAALVPPSHPVSLPPPNTTAPSRQATGGVGLLSEAVLDRLARQLEQQVKSMIAESIRPLQAEVTTLKEELARREGSHSRFEVSLSNIPPELEKQLELRLRRDLAPRLLDEARQQSAHLLAAAKAAIDQRTSQSCETFFRRLEEELKAVEKQAQNISVSMSEHAREQLRRGLEDFHQKLLNGGNSLKRLSEELLQYLQDNLNAAHDDRRKELEQFRSSLAAESTRSQQHFESLDSRISKLDESVCCLEAGLDQRLSQVASNSVRNVRNELERVSNDILAELATRSVKVLAHQLDEASGSLKIVQKEIVTSASESLKGQAADTLCAFEQSTEKLARFYVERWGLNLTAALNALAKNVGEQFQPEAQSGGNE